MLDKDQVTGTDSEGNLTPSSDKENRRDVDAKELASKNSTTPEVDGEEKETGQPQDQDGEDEKQIYDIEDEDDPVKDKPQKPYPTATKRKMKKYSSGFTKARGGETQP